MTVMLLQRSATPQLTHSQKAAENHNSTEPPFLILLDIQEQAELERATSGYDTFNNNNNNNNNSSSNNNNNNINSGAGEKTERKNIALIGRSSTCGSASACGPGGVWNKSAGGGGGPAPGSIAMRYYRLWIYACNIVLLGSAIGLAAAVSRTLVFSGDPRRYLVPGVPRAYDPTSLYAYLALGIQLGLVQLLGCIAARRLSAKLLNAYWVLLLALLFGDAVIGVAWVFRFERMRAELKPSLRLRLQVEYGKDSRFGEQLDQLQREFSCCGVTGPLDFGGSSWPQSCCPSGGEDGAGDAAANATGSENGTVANLTRSEACPEPYAQGCEAHLLHWLRKTADLLFVIGFCVMAFTKLCFLGILRYEIREMIQKIRLLREPPPPSVPFIQSFCPGQPPPVPSQPQPPPGQQQQLMEIPMNNGNIARRTTLPIVTTHTTSGTTSLFVQGDECTNSKHPLLASNMQDGGADSDTNSHCALILEESTPPAQHHSNAATAVAAASLREKSNGNNNYEMREFNRRLLFPNGGPATSGSQPLCTQQQQTSQQPTSQSSQQQQLQQPSSQLRRT